MRTYIDNCYKFIFFILYSVQKKISSVCMFVL